MQMDYTLKPLPPNLDRGLTIVNAEAGIMSIGGDYRFGSWSLTTVSAEAKAGASLDYSFGIRAYYDSERGRVEIWFI